MIDEKLIKRFIEGAKEAFKKVEDPTFTFPMNILSAYELATSIEELLKEWESKVITREELKQFVGRPCWFESHGTYKGKEGFWIIPSMFRTFSAGTIISYVSVLMKNSEYGMADTGELGLSAYNKVWRCWSSKPTDEQRKAVKWE